VDLGPCPREPPGGIVEALGRTVAQVIERNRAKDRKAHA